MRLFLVIFLIIIACGCVSPQIVSDSPASLAGCENLSRENYSISPAVFENLPPIPACFVSLVEKYHSGQFTDAFFFTPSFFSQPEFFPEFSKSGTAYWTSPSASHWGAIGYGAFPSQQEKVLHPNDELRLRVFLHSGFGVRSFQGMSLRAEVQLLSGDAILVELDDASKSGFVLGPTFPKFDGRWVHPVDVVVRVPSNVRVGSDAIISLVVQSPPSSLRENGLSEWGSAYYDATSFVGERTVYTLRVRTS